MAIHLEFSSLKFINYRGQQGIEPCHGAHAHEPRIKRIYDCFLFLGLFHLSSKVLLFNEPSLKIHHRALICNHFQSNFRRERQILGVFHPRMRSLVVDCRMIASKV